jgi:hypothetical protein
VADEALLAAASAAFFAAPLTLRAAEPALLEAALTLSLALADRLLALAEATEEALSTVP